MQERHAAAADTDARRLVDEFKAGGICLLERTVDVRGLVRDVMQSRASRGEELADRGLRAERLQQLHMTLADLEQHGFDTLLLDDLAMLLRHGELLLVELDR